MPSSHPNLPAPATPRLVVGVYYDFASSMCYLAHRILERLSSDLDGLGIDLLWLPLDLTMITDWRRGDPIKGERRQRLFATSRELDVPIAPPGHWMDSRPAMALAIHLAGTGLEAAWRKRVFSAVYDEEQCLDSPELLERLQAELGIPTPALDLEPLAEQTREAAASGVCGVPTFLLDVWPVGGIQDEETMRTFLTRWAERKREDDRGLRVH